MGASSAGCLSDTLALPFGARLLVGGAGGDCNWVCAIRHVPLAPRLPGWGYILEMHCGFEVWDRCVSVKVDVAVNSLLDSPTTSPKLSLARVARGSDAVTVYSYRLGAHIGKSVCGCSDSQSIDSTKEICS